MPIALRFYTLVVVKNALQQLLAEPRAPSPPRRVWRDWLLVASLVTSSVLEAANRNDVIWLPVALALAIGLAPTLLWRRTHPLLVVATGFGAVAVLDVVAILSGTPAIGLYSMAYLVILPYSLFRWGSGREISIGMIFIVAVLILGNVVDFNGFGEALSGAVVLLLPAILGVTLRFRATSRERERDQIRLLEREQLARELHDTVAHHVSAIAIQAQAGQAVAGSSHDAAIETLRVIEKEATRTLSEMRVMVGMLRQGDDADLAPQSGVQDIARFASKSDIGPVIDVQFDGDLDSLDQALDSALYRIAQESITNAVRHARNPTSIVVSVSADPGYVRLLVRDDGEQGGPAGEGYGLIGMSERASLLGGHLEAGPGPEQGWQVEAVLPRSGAPQ